MRQRERRVAVDAPAKLNLGLEVLGRRDDRYHDLATIFLAVDLYDQLILSERLENPHLRPLSHRELTGGGKERQWSQGTAATATVAPHPQPRPLPSLPLPGGGVSPRSGEKGVRLEPTLSPSPPLPAPRGEGGRGVRADAGDPDAPVTPLPPPVSHCAGRGKPVSAPGLKAKQCFSGEVNFDERPGGSDFAEEPNLALRALRVLGEEFGLRGGARLSLKKRIPVAAGLGGASSDAAAVLLAARELWGLEIGDDGLREIAARLGSDVPFFLQGGCALGRGRGEQLTALPVPGGVWFVLVVPEVTVERKTATLFASLEAGDFSDGSRIATQAARLQQGLGFEAALLGNAFARTLYRIVPELASLPGVMREAGAETVAITGAGPAHYAVVEDEAAAERIAARLCQRLGDWARVMVVRPVAGVEESRRRGVEK